MRLAMTAPADDNPHATTLLAAMQAAGEHVACVIVTKQSRIDRFMQYARAFGLSSAVRQALARYGPAGVRNDLVRHELNALATSRQLADWDQSLSRTCRSSGAAFLEVVSVNDPAVMNAVRESGVDLLLNTTGQIYRSAMLAAPRIGILNAHMAHLPDFRGMNVLEWSVLCGRPVGVSVHFMTERIDMGNVVCASNVEVKNGDTLDTLRAKAIATSIGLFQEAISQLQRGPLPTYPPDKPAGRQYFVMHPRLRAIAEIRLASAADSDAEKIR